jgi:hypothetical protein
VELLCCFVHLPELLTIAGHEHRDFIGSVGKMEQGPVHFVLQVRELGEIFEMRCLLFHFLPQVLNRIEIWRIGRQLFDDQAIGMRLEKRLHRLARVITGSVLNDHDRLGRLRQDVEQKRRITRRVEAPSMGLVEESTGDIINETKALVRLAFAAGRDLGLLPLRRPGVAQRAPLGKTGLIAKESQGFALLGLA